MSSLRNFSRVRRVVAAAMLLWLLVPAGARGAKPEAQRHLEKALARHKAYDKHYIKGDYTRALKEMGAATKLYAEGARRFPTNTSFNFGLGVFHNVRGEYTEAARALGRELKILQDFKGPAWNQSKFITAACLGEAWEHLFDYDRAAGFYKQALRYRKGDAKTRKAVERCAKLKREFDELPKWLAAAKVPEGTTVQVIYDVSPWSYPGHRRGMYRLEYRSGRVRAYLKIPLLYRGDKANRRKVVQRLKHIMELVEECFGRSGIHLRVEYSFVPGPRELPGSRGVTIWDHYRPKDLRMGDERNWAVLSARGLPLSAGQAASTVAHEVGHLLGLGHPPYYPDEPYTDVMTSGRPWSSVAGKRVFPGDVKTIARPLFAPKEVRGVFTRFRALVKSRKRDEAIALLAGACRKCPQDLILHLSYANALFDKGRFAEAAEAYSAVLRLRPQDFRVHFFRGVAFSRAGKYQKAIDDFTRIVAQHSGGLHAAAYHERANAYAKLGLHDRARADRRKAREATTRPTKDPETRPATSPAKTGTGSEGP